MENLEELENSIRTVMNGCKEHTINVVIDLVKDKINTPHFGEFDESVKFEMSHHLERWGDESKTSPFQFVMVISYISGKLIKALWDLDKKKFEHHLITIAAVCGTVHRYFKKEGTQSNKYFNK